MPIRITEPQSQLPHNTHYVAYGRGGAGNYRQLPSAPAAVPAATEPAAAADSEGQVRHHQRRPSMSANPIAGPQTASRYATGRGGAGNMHPASERPMFFFDEELERMYARDEHAAPVFHIGRGGAGNTLAGPPSSVADSAAAYGPRRSGDSSRRSSNGSTESASRGRFSGDEVLRKISQTFSRH